MLQYDKCNAMVAHSSNSTHSDKHPCSDQQTHSANMHCQRHRSTSVWLSVDSARWQLLLTIMLTYLWTENLHSSGKRGEKQSSSGAHAVPHHHHTLVLVCHLLQSVVVIIKPLIPTCRTGPCAIPESCSSRFPVRLQGQHGS